MKIPNVILTSISWCINAKNSLHSVQEFSPYQLAIGKNPKLLSTLNEKAPALTCQPESKIVSSNLGAIYRAREAFIASKNFKKIRRALSQNIRTSGNTKYITGNTKYITGNTKYITGDSVYYKHMDSREWHKPAKVLGQDSQQVLIKNGSTYIRVQPCCLQLINQNSKNHQDALTPPYNSNENKKYNPQPDNKINKNVEII